MERRPRILFISHAPEDEMWCERLMQQLAPLVRSGRIAVRAPSDVPPGSDRGQAFARFVGEARTVVSMISASYLASPDVQRQQIQPILQERASRPSLRVVPVLVKACLFEEEPWLASLQVLPRDKTPLARDGRAAQDEALCAVASEIAEMLAEDEPQPSKEYLAARQSMVSLLAQLFSLRDLQAFLQGAPGGAGLFARLPTDITDKSEWTALAVDVLLQRGLLDDALFERLLQARSFRAQEIARVQAECCLVFPGVTAPLPRVSSMDSPPEVAPSWSGPTSPPGPTNLPGSFGRLTVRSALGAALRLDRTSQWAAVLEACSGPDNVFFLLHGQARQSLRLFLDRVHYYLTEESRQPHGVLRVPFRIESSFATTGAEWELHMCYALAPGRPGTAAQHLAAAAAHQPVLIVLGLRPLRQLTIEQQSGIRELLCETLPRVLFAARPAQPVRLLMAMDFEPQETPLEASIEGWALAGERTGAFRYCALPEVTFPTWDEVNTYLRALRPRPATTTIESIRREYESLLGQSDTTFQALAERLDRQLEDV